MIDKLEKLLASSKEVVVVAHVKPDADTLGSCSALYSYMLQLHKKVHFVCKTKEIEKKFAFIPWSEKIRSTLPKKYDLAFVCDCASMQRTGFEIASWVVVIDHHKTNGGFGTLRFIDERAISSTQVVYELLKKLRTKINPKMATALYAGLVEDSRGFSTQDVDGMVFAFAKELVELGANHPLVVKYLQKYSTLSHLRLLGRMLESMELLLDASLAVFEVERELLERCGANEEDAKEALERALELPSVRVSLLLVRTGDGGVKVSLRSEDVDVASIAKEFGGGGHSYRSGCEFPPVADMKNIKRKIIQKVEKIEKEKK